MRQRGPREWSASPRLTAPSGQLAWNVGDGDDDGGVTRAVDCYITESSQNNLKF